MSEYWIWSNEHGGWYGKERGTHTNQLHMAGRYAEHLAMQIVARKNEDVSPTDYPKVVMVVVNKRFLTAEAQKVLAEYEQTGDRSVIDNAFFEAQDRALRNGPDFQASFTQMMSGEGRTIRQ